MLNTRVSVVGYNIIYIYCDFEFRQQLGKQYIICYLCSNLCVRIITIYLQRSAATYIYIAKFSKMAAAILERNPDLQTRSNQFCHKKIVKYKCFIVHTKVDAWQCENCSEYYSIHVCVYVSIYKYVFIFNTYVYICYVPYKRVLRGFILFIFTIFGRGTTAVRWFLLRKKRPQYLCRLQRV